MLFNYGYDNYALKKLREKDAIAIQIEVDKATKDTKNLDLLIENDIYAVVPQSELNNDFETNIEIDDNLVAPISLNQVVGTITYSIDGINYSANLLASHSVEKNNFIYLSVRTILILFILFCLYRLLFRKNKKKKKMKRKKSAKRTNNKYRFK